MRRPPIILLGALSAVGPLSMDVYMPQLPHIAAELETSDTMAQATMSVCMIGLGIGQLVAGPLADRFGRRRPVLVGIALFTLFSIVCMFAPTVELLLVARTLQGLAGSACMVVGLAVSRDLFTGSDLSRMLSLLGLVSSCAPIVAPVLGGWLALFMDWRGVFGVIAALGLALTVCTFFWLRETLAPDARHAGGMFGTAFQHAGVLLRDKLFMTVVLASTFGGIAFFSYLLMSSFVLQDEFGLSPQAFSIVFAINASANLVGSQVSRLIVRRLSPLRVYLIGETAIAIAGAALLIGAIVGVPHLVTMILLAVFLFASGLGGPNASTIALGTHGERAGTASALMGTFSFTIGPIVGPLLTLGGTTALIMSVSMGAAGLIAAVLVWLVVRPLAVCEPEPSV